MNPEETKKPAETEVESDAGDPVESLFASITSNWKELLIGLVIAGAIIAGFAIYQNRARAARDTAATQLAVASTASQFAEIIRQYPSTKAAEMAGLMEARTRYDSGSYSEADKLYEDFIATYPKHFMVPAARLGRIHCQEAQGLIDEALEGFKTFARENTSEPALVTVASLGEARCLRAKGKIQEAVSLYDRLLLEQPESEWKPLITDLKSSTVKDLEHLSAPVSTGPIPLAPAALVPMPAPAAADAPAAPK